MPWEKQWPDSGEISKQTDQESAICREYSSKELLSLMLGASKSKPISSQKMVLVVDQKDIKVSPKIRNQKLNLSNSSDNLKEQMSIVKKGSRMQMLKEYSKDFW